MRTIGFLKDTREEGFYNTIKEFSREAVDKDKLGNETVIVTILTNEGKTDKTKMTYAQYNAFITAFKLSVTTHTSTLILKEDGNLQVLDGCDCPDPGTV